MEKDFTVAYMSGMETEVKEELGKIGTVGTKYPTSHAFHFVSKAAKAEIEAIKGVLLVEEEK